MKWDDLNVLLKVSRSRTMTEAATHLRVDQTTISRRLRALEDDLGVQLVVRRRDGIDLTDAGRTAANVAERMETLHLDLERQLVGTDAKLAGRLRVTTADLTTFLHPELFSVFAERYPEVTLEVETPSRRRSLSRRDADVAIRFTAEPDWGLIAHKLARVEFAVYVSRALKQVTGARAGLTSYPWVSITENTPSPDVHRYMQTHVPGARVVCRYEDLLSIYAAVRGGVGAAILPCALGDSDADLVRAHSALAGFGYDIWCLAHPDLAETARVRAFMTHTCEYFATRVDLYAGKSAARSRSRARRTS